MERFKNILVATDTRLEQHVVVDKAAELVLQNQAAFAIVDVVPEISWVPSKLISDLDYMRELYAQEVADKLEALAATIRDQGVDVSPQVLSEKTSVEVVRDVLREKHDLPMVVAKGRNSKRKGFFGYTAIHLLQACPGAVWLQADRSSTSTHHVLGCVDIISDQPDTSELNDRVFNLTWSIGKSCQALRSLLHAWHLIGNTAQQTLDRIECSLLALKPYTFVSPSKLASCAQPTASRV